MKAAVVHMEFTHSWPARLRALGERLDAVGHSLHVIEVLPTTSGYRTTSEGNASEVPRVFPAAGFASQAHHPKAVKAWVQRELDRLQPDVVMAVAIAFPTGIAAVEWCRSNRRGVVICDDARIQDVPRPIWVDAVKRHIYRNVDAMLLPAESYLATSRFFGIPDNRVFFGSNVVDVAWFAERAEVARATDMGLKAPIPTNTPYFLGLGRHVAKKNWITLIEAYRHYRTATTTPWRLVLVGNGPEGQRIRARVDELRLEDVCICPEVAEDDLIALYARAGCVVLPSYFGETWGLVVNEALACGTPVLVSEECGCASTLVKAGVNGWTFSPHNVRALAARMGDIASGPLQVRETMRKAAAQIGEEWSLDRFAQGACDAISLAARSRAGYRSLFDRFLIGFWKGRFRPT